MDRIEARRSELVAELKKQSAACNGALKKIRRAQTSIRALRDVISVERETLRICRARKREIRVELRALRGS